MFRHWDYGVSLAILGLLLASGTLFAVAKGVSADGSIRAELFRAAVIQRQTPEATAMARNQRLNELFRDYLVVHQGESTAELVRRFNALLKEHHLSNFDDFLAAMTRPVVYVPDRATGEAVPVYGPLGSDVINPWLAAAAVVEDRPLDEQPMYHSAIRALRENIDFAAIGVKDPNLSIDLLPDQLRENARWAYARLNPTNRFEGGFDHPLFYCVVREAAEKFFRQDHPQARLSMADLVNPVVEGGFGIESCLLCHERDHSGVYRRLLGQGTYLSAKAEALRAAQRQRDVAEDDPTKVQSEAEVFLLAAQRVLRAFPDQIDEAAIRQSLLTPSKGNYERLMPGYDDFVDALGRVGCLQCHGADAEVSDELNPVCYGAFVLDNSAYNKNANVRALCEHVDFEDIARSRLLAKAANLLEHEGAARVRLDEARVKLLLDALTRWLQPFREARDDRSTAHPPARAAADRAVAGESRHPGRLEKTRVPSAAACSAAAVVQCSANQERPSAPQP